jgi:lipoprotein LprG
MTTSAGPSRRTALIAAGVLAVALALTGCGSSSGSGTASNPAAVKAALAKAKQNFDKATGVHFTMSTSAKPSGDAILGADGKLTNQPAFDGSAKVVYHGFTVDVPAISVGGKFYAKLPFTPGFEQHNPAEFSAPDPADFINPTKGISALLLQLTGTKLTGQTRQGKTIVTNYSGSLPGNLIAGIIPSANAKGTYQAVVGIADDQLTTLAITGDFFSGSGPATFNLVFDDYNKIAKISAP